MAKIINKTLTKTKEFFKAKPTRIIIALSIIAAIMIGAALGIMALARAMTDKCANQPGTEWNADLNKCVKRGCNNVCQTGGRKGSCDDNICEGSNKEGFPYIYDSNLCECVLDCSSAGTDKYGREYTSFYWDGTTSTSMNTDGTPQKELYCGIKCDYAKKNDRTTTGIGNCPEGHLCAQNILETGRIDNEGYCLNNSYSMCDSPNPNDVACEKLSDCEDSNDNIKCKVEQCITNLQNNQLALCKDNNDCVNTGDCVPITQLGEIKINDKIVKDFSKFDPNNLKYCKNSSTYRSSDSKCVTYSGVSEYGSKFENHSDCNTSDNTSKIGISMYHPQCYGSIDTSNGCIKNNYTLCPNGWQASPNTSEYEYCLSNSEITPGNWKDASTLDKGYCCDINQRKGHSGDYYCCASTTYPDDPYCFNKSAGPADISLLDTNPNPPYTYKTCTLSPGTTIGTETNSSDPLLKTYSTNLRNILSATTASNIEEDNYVGVICESYCEESGGICQPKLSAPVYKVVAGTNKNTSSTSSTSSYSITPSGITPGTNIETYQVIKKNNCKAIFSNPLTANNSSTYKYNIPLCTHYDDSGTSGKNYWHAEGDKLGGLQQRINVSFFNNSTPPSKCTDGNADFLKNIAKQEFNVQNIQYNTTDNNYTIINECNKLMVNLPKNDGNDEPVSWSKINTDDSPNINYSKVFDNNKPSSGCTYCGTCNSFTIPINHTEQTLKNVPGTDICQINSNNNTQLLAADGEYCNGHGVDRNSGNCLPSQEFNENFYNVKYGDTENTIDNGDNGDNGDVGDVDDASPYFYLSLNKQEQTSSGEITFVDNKSNEYNKLVVPFSGTSSQITKNPNSNADTVNFIKGSGNQGDMITCTDADSNIVECCGIYDSYNNSKIIGYTNDFNIMPTSFQCKNNDGNYTRCVHYNNNGNGCGKDANIGSDAEYYNTYTSFVPNCTSCKISSYVKQVQGTDKKNKLQINRVAPHEISAGFCKSTIGWPVEDKISIDTFAYDFKPVSIQSNHTDIAILILSCKDSNGNELFLNCTKPGSDGTSYLTLSESTDYLRLFWGYFPCNGGCNLSYINNKCLNSALSFDQSANPGGGTQPSQGVGGLHSSCFVTLIDGKWRKFFASTNGGTYSTQNPWVKARAGKQFETDPNIPHNSIWGAVTVTLNDTWTYKCANRDNTLYLWSVYPTAGGDTNYHYSITGTDHNQSRPTAVAKVDSDNNIYFETQWNLRDNNFFTFMKSNKDNVTPFIPRLMVTTAGNTDVDPPVIQNPVGTCSGYSNIGNFAYSWPRDGKEGGTVKPTQDSLVEGIINGKVTIGDILKSIPVKGIMDSIPDDPGCAW